MVWTGLSRQLGRVKEEADLAGAAARFVAETFDAMSVTVWLLEAGKSRFVAAASTAGRGGAARQETTSAGAAEAVAAGLLARCAPFELDSVDGAWAGELRELNPSTFPENGGSRWCVPLSSAEQCVGTLVLADRVNGALYTSEEIDLLKCIGDQVTSVLLNLRLASEIGRAKELEAFRTMSAFFVHDLKNAASSLNLDPEEPPGAL